MERMEILLGFHFPEFEKGLTASLYDLGYDAKIIEKHTKMQIREYILMHRECRVVILKERDSTMSFTAEDFAVLTDENDDLIVICVLSEERRGTDYMQVLYAAGITNAIFQSGREGVRPSQIAELCLKKKSRKDARKYYGIASVDMDIGMLSPEAYSIYYQSLFNKENGSSLILRYLNVASRLTAAQNEDFINRLPGEIVDELREYEEFYVILDGLKAHGIDLKYKRPKHVKVGIKQAPALTLPQKKQVPKGNQKPAENVTGAFDFGDEFGSFDYGDEFGKEDDEEVSFPEEEVYEEFSEPEEEQEKEEPEEKKKASPILFVLIGVVFLLTAALVAGVFLVEKVVIPQVIEETKNTRETVAPSEVVSVEEPGSEAASPEEPEIHYPEVGVAMQEILNRGEPVKGEMVITLINRYPEQQFRYVDEEKNKQVVYKYVVASEAEIPPDADFELRKEEGEYIFTKK